MDTFAPIHVINKKIRDMIGHGRTAGRQGGRAAGRQDADSYKIHALLWAPEYIHYHSLTNIINPQLLVVITKSS